MNTTRLLGNLGLGIVAAAMTCTAWADPILLKVPGPPDASFGPDGSLPFHADGTAQLSDSFFDIFVEIDTPLLPVDSFFDVFVSIDLMHRPGVPPLGPTPPDGPLPIPIEMVALHLTSLHPIFVTLGGGPLPPVPIEIRALQLTGGQTTGFSMGNGNYRIDSFFDVFVELSLDEGATWLPAAGPTSLRVQGTPIPDASSTLCLLLFPAAVLGMISRLRRRRRRRTHLTPGWPGLQTLTARAMVRSIDFQPTHGGRAGRAQPPATPWVFTKSE
jgi:hypothetical protein